MKPPVHLFVFGLGYAGARLALAMREQAQWVGGTVRDVEDAVALAAHGLRTFVFGGAQAGIGVAEAVRHCTHLLASVPPGDGDPVLTCHGASIIAADHLRWIGYLSTVGVYGDHGGDWVDETTAPAPAAGRSAARLAAEQAWQALAAERRVPLAIFRIAGIYGPGRNAFVNLAAGTAHRVIKAGQVFNRIHVDDLVAALGAAIGRDVAGIFNLADDEPAPPEEVVAYAAKLMGVPPPPAVPFAVADLSPMARSFYGENKRVTNDRLKSALGIALRYPTYREGLAALWHDANWRVDLAATGSRAPSG
jgi:nucleoside-diphosphate-sugar epimerase